MFDNTMSPKVTGEASVDGPLLQGTYSNIAIYKASHQQKQGHGDIYTSLMYLHCSGCTAHRYIYR